ncbi:MAG: peptide chain release factor N(5)-glutamine methyltransferase [Rickettsiales bacterium]|nr:peptide chain release factor N(5)-glutamine methyltransferase [Rickettsiales bacterium]
MKISSALAQARLELDSKGVSSSKLDSLILLSHALLVSKEQIIFNPDRELNEAQQKVFFDLIKRRAAREPVSHLINKREFFGEDFFVSKDVLDPRPDSESLIELVLKKLPDKNQKLKILEIGVGSGCLVITLLKAFQMADAIGVDISEEALKICQKNAETHQVQNRLNLKKSDLFSALNPNEKFDLIISNPPYIPSQEIETLEPEVKNHEPRTALDGGADGLDLYKKIAASAKNFLKKDGKIILEIGFGQQKDVTKIFADNGLLLIDSRRDLSGIERALCFNSRSTSSSGSSFG